MNLERQRIKQAQQEMLDRNKKEYQERMLREKLKREVEDKIIYNQVYKPEAIKLKIIQNYNLLSKVNSSKVSFFFFFFFVKEIQLF